MLRDMMIYDYSGGFENAVVIVADSGKLNISDDKKNLILTLYQGESFGNMNKRKTRNVNERVPYRRESFQLRTILIDYDTNFNLADESMMGNRDVGKNVNELATYIDSVRYRNDSVDVAIAPLIKQKTYQATFENKSFIQSNKVPDQRDTLFIKGFQSYYDQLNPEDQINYLQISKSKAAQIKLEYNIYMFHQNEMKNGIRSHLILMHRKFSIAVSCLLFFFIGAPLGAIIRRGGLGMPAVLSVLLFLLYYMIDTFGMKMAKQGVWPVWEGIWLSTAVLAALGFFFTYQAVNDSTIMNPDAWKNGMERILRRFTKRRKMK